MQPFLVLKALQVCATLGSVSVAYLLSKLNANGK